MKAPDTCRTAGCTQRSRDIYCAWKLVGLHADQADQRTPAVRADLREDLVGSNARVCLVPDGNADFDVVTQHAALRAIERQAVQSCKCISRNRRSGPLNNV